jgi:hypothetical protein
VAGLDLVVGEHAEGRNDIVREVLVLVVAPEDAHVGSEVVEELARAAEVTHERLAVRRRGGGPPVRAVFLAHGRRPVARVAISLGQARVREDRAQDPRHVMIGADERRVMRHPEA